MPVACLLSLCTSLREDILIYSSTHYTHGAERRDMHKKHMETREEFCFSLLLTAHTSVRHKYHKNKPKAKKIKTNVVYHMRTFAYIHQFGRT